MDLPYGGEMNCATHYRPKEPPEAQEPEGSDIALHGLRRRGPTFAPSYTGTTPGIAIAAWACRPRRWSIRDGPRRSSPRGNASFGDAYTRHPERFVKGPPQAPPIPAEVSINPPPSTIEWGELLSKGVEKEKRRPYPSYFSSTPQTARMTPGLEGESRREGIYVGDPPARPCPPGRPWKDGSGAGSRTCCSGSWRRR